MPHCFHPLTTTVRYCHCGKAIASADWVQGTYAPTCAGKRCSDVEAHGKRAPYLGRAGEHLCQTHALKEVRRRGLQVLHLDDRARFLAENPGYASGALPRAG